MTSEREMYVAHCKECGVIDESFIPTNASDAARHHKATTTRPGKPGHDVVAMPKSVWLRGEREAQAVKNAALVAAKPALIHAPVVGAYATWRTFYAGRGLRLTPLHAPCKTCRAAPATANQCKVCGGGKMPLLSGWQEGGALVDGGNVGIVCGRVSGHLTVLDFDTPGVLGKLFGMSAIALAERTMIVETFRGHHVYLRAEGVGCSKPRICTTCWRHEDAHPWALCEKPGLVVSFDVKGEGGQVVAPPSTHATGRQYRLIPGTAVAEGLIVDASVVLRPEVLQLLREPFRRASNTNGGNTADNTNATQPPAAPPTAAAQAAAEAALVPVSMERIKKWVAYQATGFQIHWQVLTGSTPPLPSEEGGRSRSDWVLSLCLAEMRLSPEEIAWVLCQLPGSKARDPQHGATYALMTARNAVMFKMAQAMSRMLSPRAVG
jgi:Bifunctional DNA primase/polymerase, N-terminal